jgi:hypothetical protein
VCYANENMEIAAARDEARLMKKKNLVLLFVFAPSLLIATAFVTQESKLGRRRVTAFTIKGLYTHPFACSRLMSKVEGRKGGSSIEINV